MRVRTGRVLITVLALSAISTMTLAPGALLPDSNPALTWIGAKPFYLGSEMPQGEGISTHSGKRFSSGPW